jgi:hypothetical protein
VASRETSFQEQFLDVPIRKREPQIPTDRANNDLGFEVPPFEQRWPRFDHGAYCSLSDSFTEFLQHSRLSALWPSQRPYCAPNVKTAPIVTRRLFWFWEPYLLDLRELPRSPIPDIRLGGGELLFDVFADQPLRPFRKREFVCQAAFEKHTDAGMSLAMNSEASRLPAWLKCKPG